MAHVNPTWPTAGAVGWSAQMNGGLDSITTQTNLHDDQLNATTGYDIVLLWGQSNMSGRGSYDITYYDRPNDRADQFAAAGTYAGVISAAVDPLGHADNVALVNQLGPGTSFARWYATIIPNGRRILLVPSAYGGTPLVSSATLGWRRGVAGNLYAQALSQAQTALAMAGSNSKIVACLWIQGEQDGNVNITGSAYQTDFDALITGLRTDLSLPNLPFIIGQMVPEYLGTGTRNAIDVVQAATPSRLTNIGYTQGPTNQNNGDGNHYNGLGQRLMGKYLFASYRNVVFGTAAPVLNDGNLAIQNSTAPTISGTTTSGSVLTSTTGTWTNSPTTYAYQWSRGGTAISGATSSTYTLTAADVASVISVSVTASRTGYASASASSTNTALIGSPTTYMADTFNRANSTTVLGSTTTGAFAWTVLSGTWGISSNAAYDSAPVASTNHAAIVTDAQADGTLTMTIGVTGSSSGNGGIIFRAVDDANYLMFTTAGTVYTRITGTFTSIGGVTNLVASVGDVYAVTLSGSTITAKQNGITIWSGTNTTNQTSTKHGLRSYSTTGMTFDAITHVA